MDALVNSLMEELNCETVFTIPIFGGIPIYESVVVTWIIMAVVIVLCILLTRNLSVEHPGRRQIILETAVNGLNNFFRDTIGENGKRYIPYLMTGIRRKGTKGWLKSFAEPMPVVLPINILEVFIKPLSLCMRLFGNVLGSFVIMELLKMVVPAILPAVFSCYFDIFDGLIQAYVFVFLTALFVKEATE